MYFGLFILVTRRSIYSTNTHTIQLYSTYLFEGGVLRVTLSSVSLHKLTMSFSRREEYLYKLSTQSLSKLLFHLFFNGSFRDIMLFSAGINLICTKHSYSYLHALFFFFIIILIIKINIIVLVFR